MGHSIYIQKATKEKEQDIDPILIFFRRNFIHLLQEIHVLQIHLFHMSFFMGFLLSDWSNNIKLCSSETYLQFMLITCLCKLDLKCFSWIVIKCLWFWSSYYLSISEWDVCIYMNETYLILCFILYEEQSLHGNRGYADKSTCLQILIAGTRYIWIWDIGDVVPSEQQKQSL